MPEFICPDEAVDDFQFYESVYRAELTFRLCPERRRMNRDFSEDFAHDVVERYIYMLRMHTFSDEEPIGSMGPIIMDRGFLSPDVLDELQKVRGCLFNGMAALNSAAEDLLDAKTLEYMRYRYPLPPPQRHAKKFADIHSAAEELSKLQWLAVSYYLKCFRHEFTLRLYNEEDQCEFHIPPNVIDALNEYVDKIKRVAYGMKAEKA